MLNSVVLAGLVNCCKNTICRYIVVMVTKKVKVGKLGHTVQFRLSDDELERWRLVLAKDGFDTMSEWLRHMARLRVKKVEGSP